MGVDIPRFRQLYYLSPNHAARSFLLDVVNGGGAFSPRYCPVRGAVTSARERPEDLREHECLSPLEFTGQCIWDHVVGPRHMHCDVWYITRRSNVQRYFTGSALVPGARSEVLIECHRPLLLSSVQIVAPRLWVRSRPGDKPPDQKSAARC